MEGSYSIYTHVELLFDYHYQTRDIEGMVGSDIERVWETWRERLIGDISLLVEPLLLQYHDEHWWEDIKSAMSNYHDRDDPDGEDYNIPGFGDLARLHVIAEMAVYFHGMDDPDYPEAYNEVPEYDDFYSPDENPFEYTRNTAKAA